jgi:4-methylaminobutanoate oxidase (formaldehyde-forming)
MTAALPERARVVVIGGGIIGSSVAYHLAHLGWRDVVLLERHRLTAGTTWHAAGLMVTFGSTSETSTEMRKYSCDLYARLEAETGQSTGFRRTGFIEVAADRDRLEASSTSVRAPSSPTREASTSRSARARVVTGFLRAAMIPLKLG